MFKWTDSDFIGLHSICPFMHYIISSDPIEMLHQTVNVLVYVSPKRRNTNVNNELQNSSC